MKVRLCSKKDLLKIWKDDFLGNRGFFLPGESKFSLGEEIELAFETDNESLGKARACVVWQNIYGRISEFTPRGTFLRVISMDPELEKNIGV